MREALEILRGDMLMLQSGEWIPDDDSIQASIDVIEAALGDEAEAELLEALEMAKRALEDHDIDEIMSGEFEVITDAIAKARGRA
jgi:hypothetical protein